MTIAEKIMVSGATAEKPDQSADKETDKAPDKMTDKRKALGRGLDSLLPGRPRVVSPTPPAVISGNKEPLSGQGAGLAEARAAHAHSGDEVEQIALDKIDANPYQTRQQLTKALSKSWRNPFG